MSDAAAVRREARRRRILENSHDRLQRITGKNPSEGDALPAKNILETVTEPVTPTESFSPTLQESNHIDYDDIVSSSSSGSHPFDNISSCPSTAQAVTEYSWLDKFFASKLDIVLVSLLVQTLWNTAKVSHNLFLPIFLLEFIKMWIRRDCQESGFIGAMLLLNGVSPRRVKMITKWVSSIQTIIKDCCIYLFITICIQFMYCTLIKHDFDPEDDLDIDFNSDL